MEDRIKTRIPNDQPCSRRGVLYVLRRRELDGRSADVRSFATVVGAEFIEAINVKSETDTWSCYVTGMVALPDGILVMCDYANYSLKVVDVKTGTINAAKTFSSRPLDIVTITFRKVAIILPCAKKILILKIDDDIEIVQTMAVAHDYSDTIRFCNGKLIVDSFSVKTMQVFDSDGQLLNKIDYAENHGKNVLGCYLNAPEAMFHCQREREDFVSSIDSFIYVDTNNASEITNYPHVRTRAITAAIDNQSNAYIIMSKISAIDQISSDLKSITPLLSKEDGIRLPFCMCFSEQDDRFYVGMVRSNTINVYRRKRGRLVD